MNKVLVALLILGAASYAVAGTEINQTRELAPDGTVSIDNVKGSIKIFGWDKKEVEITGTLGNGVDKLDISGSKSRLRIKVEYPSGFWRHAKESDLVIHMPRSADAEANGVSASIVLEDVDGELDLESVSGSIRVDGGTKSVSAQSVSGSVRVESNAKRIEASSISGRVQVEASAEEVHAKSVSGSVTVEGVSGRIRASSVSGSIHVEAKTIAEAKLSTTSGSVSLEGALADGGEVDCGSHSGSVTIEFTNKPSARFDLSTFSGSIHVDLDNARGLSGGRNLSFTTGEGKGEVDANSFSGSVRISGK